MLIASRRLWRESMRLSGCHPIPAGTIGQNETHRGPPLLVAYRPAGSAAPSGYRPVQGLERRKPASRTRRNIAFLHDWLCASTTVAVSLRDTHLWRLRRKLDEH